MSAFICWSGERSRIFADRTRDLLRHVLGGVEFFLSEDLELGEAWFEALSHRLQAAKVGIVCLTADNLRSPWLHFESGALFSRSQHRGLLLYRLEADSIAIDGPLGNVQASTATLQGTRKLVASLADLLGASAPDWQASFAEYWPAFEVSLADIKTPRITDIAPTFGDYLSAKTFYSPLEQCHDQNWLDRYSRVKRTQEDLAELRPRVEQLLSQPDRETFHALVSEVDQYCRLLREIISSHRFAIEGGLTNFDKPAEATKAPAVGWIGASVEQTMATIKARTLALKGWTEKPGEVPSLPG